MTGTRFGFDDDADMAGAATQARQTLPRHVRVPVAPAPGQTACRAGARFGDDAPYRSGDLPWPRP